MWPKMYPQYFYAEYVTVAFIALTPLIDCNYELVVPLIPKASLPEQVLEENWVEPATTQAHWENGCCHASQNGESYFIMLIRPWNNIQKYQSQCMS